MISISLLEKTKPDRTKLNSKCRICGDRNKWINHNSECNIKNVGMGIITLKMWSITAVIWLYRSMVYNEKKESLGEWKIQNPLEPWFEQVTWLMMEE